MRWGELSGVMLLAAVAFGCAAGDTPQHTGQLILRDSAGVRIVENEAAPDREWSVEFEALFTVGWEEDDPSFTWIQSGRILNDGGALVGESTAGTLYRLGPDGSIVDSWGRRGEGPGEYQGIDGITLVGDSIVVSDGRLRRVTILSGRGAVLSTSPLPGSFLHHVSSVLPGGRLLFVPGEGYAGVREIRPEWVFQNQPILAWRISSPTVDTLAELPHLRRWFGTRGAGPGPVAIKGRAAGHAGGFVWGRSDQPELRWYDDAGRLTQIARWTENLPALTSEQRSHMADAFREELASRGIDEVRATARLTQMEEGLARYDGALPYWFSLLVDRAGNTWLSEYPSALIRPPDRWRVVRRDGEYLGWVHLPDALGILDATDDRLLIVRWNEWEVPAVAMLRLRRAD